MITVQNGQILSDHEKGVLSNALVEAANLWDQTAEDLIKITSPNRESNQHLAETMRKHAVKAREMALNVQTCKYVLFDQGDDGQE